MTKHQELTAYCLDHNVHLVAVSKTRSNNSILALYNDEQRIFGENKVDELVTKYKELPKDIKWHMIGHLQTNKVKSIIPFIDMIHGGDRVSVINKINSEA
ncbi:MAG: YggS family pyridoxal phosphate-dependent enzyme, partial [Saprospiraceae bacterium]